MIYRETNPIETLDEIMEVFSGDELADKLRASYGYSDSEIDDVLIEYGRR